MSRTIPIKQIKSWSFSRYSDYRQCPLKAKLKHLDRIQEPPNDAMARGAEIHTRIEKYIKGETTRLPTELKLVADEMKTLKQLFKRISQTMLVEDTWAFTKDWEETAWDNWADCWLRIKLDCAHHADDTTLVVTDWKTGKFRVEMNEDYVEQLELYALAALLLHDHIQEVQPRLVYVDYGVVYPLPDSPMIFRRKDIPQLKKRWAQRTKAMLNDKKFAPRPNDKCRWCFYRSSNKAAGGGQCKY